MFGVRTGRRAMRAAFLVAAVATLPGCEFEKDFAATCALFPPTPHGPTAVPGWVHIGADLPVFVAPGEAFTIRVDALGGDPSIVAMAPAGGYISVQGAVEPSGAFLISSAGQELPFTATGAPGDVIDVRVLSGYALFGDPVTGGASCDVDGAGDFRAILLREPA